MKRAFVLRIAFNLLVPFASADNLLTQGDACEGTRKGEERS